MAPLKQFSSSDFPITLGELYVSFKEKPGSPKFDGIESSGHFFIDSLPQRNFGRKPSESMIQSRVFSPVEVGREAEEDDDEAGEGTEELVDQGIEGQK